ncbi:hypothetical protein CEXT_225151 [Caerostris extrusa]|uniref:Uncharacterized protein n=1 Tax=Caerostris extrusa TaxID=172846 RepID=A0AAV4XLE3_CAEEX|nr:hypothetical protein CEXT_225151 [Caerostris extrusa]
MTMANELTKIIDSKASLQDYVFLFKMIAVALKLDTGNTEKQQNFLKISKKQNRSPKCVIIGMEPGHSTVLFNLRCLSTVPASVSYRLLLEYRIAFRYLKSMPFGTAGVKYSMFAVVNIIYKTSLLLVKCEPK